MHDKEKNLLVILAGGQSRRMGQDKALVEINGTRMIDLIIASFRQPGRQLILSAATDYGTGLPFVPDDSNAPPGPVGAIFSLAAYVRKAHPIVTGFATVPVDAPFAPSDLLERLSASGSSAVASDGQRIHPTFGYWRVDQVRIVAGTHDIDTRPPSLHWLARQCGAQVAEWPSDSYFTNVNTPAELLAAEKQMKKADNPG